MTDKPFDLRYIFTRERMLERRNSLNETAQIPDLSRKDSSYKLKIEKFLRECKSYKDAIGILETAFADRQMETFNESVKRVIDEIIPITENKDLNECSVYVSKASIDTISKDRIIECINACKRADRIKKNHKVFSEKFDFSTLNKKSNKEKCFAVCEVVTGYKNSRFIQCNIALEEMAYLRALNNYQISDLDLTKNILEYFLLLKDNTEEDIASYKKAIEECKVLSNEVSPLRLSFYPQSNNDNWQDDLHNWKLKPNKSINELGEIAKKNNSKLYIVEAVINVIDEFRKINHIGYDLANIFPKIDTKMSSTDTRDLLNFIVEHKIEQSDDFINSLELLWENKSQVELYDDNTKHPETFSSDEIDRFKIHNMILDSKEVEKYLDHFEQVSPIPVKKILSCDPEKQLKESTVSDLINQDGYLGINLRRYRYYNSSSDATKVISSIVKNINNTILSSKKSQAYYILDEDYVDINIRSKYKILPDELHSEYRSKLTPFDQSILIQLNESTKLINTMTKKLPSIITALRDYNFVANVSTNEAVLLYDILNPFSEPDNGFLNEFVDYCKIANNSEALKIKQECSKILHEDFELGYSEYYMNRIDLASSLIETKLQQLSENKSIVQNVKDKVSGAVDKVKSLIPSLNDIQLSWEGIKAKFKGASAKEQEISRDIDTEFNHMLKNIKNFLLSNNSREDLLTGQISVSLTKIVKMGIVLAGLGVLSGSILVPVFGAIGLLIKSKVLTDKERIRLMDEIDIELKVIEPEISKAKNSGDSAHYRRLLTIQRNLLRKRQDLKLNTMLSKHKEIPLHSSNED